jgi:hypothetical protein
MSQSAEVGAYQTQSASIGHISLPSTHACTHTKKKSKAVDSAFFHALPHPHSFCSATLHVTVLLWKSGAEAGVLRVVLRVRVQVGPGIRTCTRRRVAVGVHVGSDRVRRRPCLRVTTIDIGVVEGWLLLLLRISWKRPLRRRQLRHTSLLWVGVGAVITRIVACPLSTHGWRSRAAASRSERIYGRGGVPFLLGLPAGAVRVVLLRWGAASGHGRGSRKWWQLSRSAVCGWRSMVGVLTRVPTKVVAVVLRA